MNISVTRPNQVVFPKQAPQAPQAPQEPEGSTRESIRDFLTLTAPAATLGGVAAAATGAMGVGALGATALAVGGVVGGFLAGSFVSLALYKPVSEFLNVGDFDASVSGGVMVAGGMFGAATTAAGVVAGALGVGGLGVGLGIAGAAYAIPALAKVASGE